MYSCCFLFVYVAFLLSCLLWLGCVLVICGFIFLGLVFDCLFGIMMFGRLFMFNSVACYYMFVYVVLRVLVIYLVGWVLNCLILVGRLLGLFVLCCGFG